MVFSPTDTSRVSAVTVVVELSSDCPPFVIGHRGRVLLVVEKTFGQGVARSES